MLILCFLITISFLCFSVLIFVRNPKFVNARVNSTPTFVIPLHPSMLSMLVKFFSLIISDGKVKCRFVCRHEHSRSCPDIQPRDTLRANEAADNAYTRAVSLVSKQGIYLIQNISSLHFQKF